MKKAGKVLIWVAIIGVIVSGVIAYKIWNAPHRDVMDESAVKVSAEAIADSYANDEPKSNKLYLNKAIQVSGIVDAVETTPEGKIILSFKTSNPMAGVRCTMKAQPAAVPGDSATIRGICSGYLLDVTLIDSYEVQ